MRLDRAVILALPEAEKGPMVSRLASYLHPVAGRPLIWHTVRSFLEAEKAPGKVLVLAPEGFPIELLDDLRSAVELKAFDPSVPIHGSAKPDQKVLLAHGSASVDPATVDRLLAADVGTWVGGSDSQAAAAVLNWGQIDGLIRAPEPFTVPNGYLSPLRRMKGTPGAFVVSNRQDLSRFQQRIRDQLVASLMEAGVTFLLPDSVMVDVDVRIGRDSVIYPGVILEGETNIGDETVIGPGCRIIDSWIGSGVEMKGWNYVAHTSVRNRAILEPHVRRGFD
jgi:hypothetical protein